MSEGRMKKGKREKEREREKKKKKKKNQSMFMFGTTRESSQIQGEPLREKLHPLRQQHSTALKRNKRKGGNGREKRIKF